MKGKARKWSPGDLLFALCFVAGMVALFSENLRYMAFSAMGLIVVMVVVPTAPEVSLRGVDDD